MPISRPVALQGKRGRRLHSVCPYQKPHPRSLCRFLIVPDESEDSRVLVVFPDHADAAPISVERERFLSLLASR
jgi:predicted deacetylase